MISLRSFVALTLAAVALSACTTISAVPAGPVKMGGGQEVTLQRAWADITPLMGLRQKNVRILSIDGPLLNRLYLAQGLADGESLVRRPSKEKPVPVFHADMSQTEIVEFLSESIAA